MVNDNVNHWINITQIRRYDHTAALTIKGEQQLMYTSMVSYIIAVALGFSVFAF